MSLAKALPLPATLLEQLDLLRLDASRRLDPTTRAALGQFLTPSPIAAFMASLFEGFGREPRIVDAGCGIGNLASAVVVEACTRRPKPAKVDVTLFEIDQRLGDDLEQTMALTRKNANEAGVRCSWEIVFGDFVDLAAALIRPGLFERGGPRFTHAVLNPPYRKLNTESATRRTLSGLGIETSNLYAAFVALAVLLLEEGGEIVAITPRSFCNGPYFRPFRELLLEQLDFRRFHLFESRSDAFADDEVLQENVIFHAVKRRQRDGVIVSSSRGPGDDVTAREVDFARIVRPTDPERFIHIVPDELGQRIADLYGAFRSSLSDLGIQVSTGRVVDFRAKDYLRAEPEAGTGPLIYPTHFSSGSIAWPKAGRKPNALVAARETADLWMPSGFYVLVKRFSSKEERRRIVAAVFDPTVHPQAKLGFENHLNVFHESGHGLEPDLAWGLAVFLNSTIADEVFRQFNGHTQVNATDLRNMKYPTAAELRKLGKGAEAALGNQAAIDDLVEGLLAKGMKGGPLAIKRRVDEAIEVLRALGFPKQQQNPRSAWSLLSLLGLTPTMPWAKASAPMLGITPIMTFISDHYEHTYKPNTRETVRRQTIHQFVEAGLIVLNPDKPTRPVNSPRVVYQIEPNALAVMQAFGTDQWDASLSDYIARVGTLKAKYEAARKMTMLPVTLPDGSTLPLTPGGQNELVKHIVESFCPRFAPGGHVLYVGDAGDKFGFFDEPSLEQLGVRIEKHGKMPDVVVHHKTKNWLLLIEAVTSHGPVDAKRRKELATLFKGSTAGLVYVTTFLTKKDLVKYLGDISWETEVWIAESPDHMIHFNGERFLGPYPEDEARPPKSSRTPRSR